MLVSVVPLGVGTGMLYVPLAAVTMSATLSLTMKVNVMLGCVAGVKPEIVTGNV